ncbi:ABC transporter permease [Paenibacillus mucilaginosus]|uniref:Macrolide export ATP-binding/permease macB n=3 Tax=Paenibacillus mucilaginosus TaxID=61624 RepID=H6NL20_9BACL|nr:ABC transporter permease [Paenibacillus mucilaginosus]AEI41166.1 macrolide export ATP-binding/permease macB [Paenibacillus mucilaginosus KNP414]AFC29727.1 macrolide export ATP-binding/permease macB [Paenibacillus mucilaginosus 3016]AFH61911.1 macrolide ABC transporter ATP-binding protein [Paenibacillus mucilaginosus K02]MCG7211405.1 ABC transporter permease [Paenibacillus mucilaginosus]WDM30217.1 ABC transporter permease [Paenibacillus mucilaginosus]
MKASELIRMALRTVISSPMRTMLTMLGVIIGVASVVTLVSIGRGTTAQIEKQYEALGTNMMVVNVLGNGRATQLNYDELMELELLPEFSAIAPTMTKNSNIKYDRTQESHTLVATNDRYIDIMKGEVADGRFLVDADSELRSQVVVLGSEVATELFGTEDPIGESVNIDGVVFEIVGTLKSKGSNSTGTSLDNSVFVPLETARRAFKLGAIRTTYVEAPSNEEIYTAQATMKQYLTYKFKSDTGFTLSNQDELMNSRKEASSSLTNQLISVACISLLVGGIGIMNIMLVTVSERTREIGIRKSIGAKRRNILLQFLVESAVISGLGGFIGLALGSGLALAWPYLNPKQPTELSMDIGLYAFLFSVLVGIIFGLYPANKASKLRPIDALRTD